ncbi:MAG: hypothetical protein CV045_05530 [Cyanobacteria bacterium M5B4]|nr:MAG: hypothetical protein CV045_05530 [Cyanobacteria bacterium M5B4]
MLPSSTQLRPAQKAILESYKGGKLAIAAVPGSGKTFIIEQLVLQLIKEGTPPDRIGIGTYMRSSRGNLAQKFINHGYDRVQVFTLHSLSLQILKEFYPGSFSFNVQEEYQKERLINNLVSSWMELNRSVWHNWVAEQKIQKAEAEVSKQLANGLKTIIGKAKQKCLSAYQIKAQPNSLLSVIKELYDRYELKLAEQQRIDYDDMAVKAVKLLEENSYIRSVAQSWFDYLLEDEAQDSSPLQARMLEILSERSGNLVRVGDPNQCIMSTFTNSEPAIFRDFCDKHQRHTLNQSSRSSQKIIDLANYLVDWTNNETSFIRTTIGVKNSAHSNSRAKPIRLFV